MYERHTLMTQWLVRLGVDPAIAAEDACKIEHVISESTFEALKQHMYQHASDK
jgi:Mn-dependent DtxR family transcriptional regulator